MLIKCPECELQVSDKAISCPHCGLPFKKTTVTRESTRRKRLPNGFGQISKVKGQNLRKPFRAMVSVGKNSKGRPICKLLKPEAYFSTYNEAYEALIEYNKNPYDLDAAMTVKELYEKWTDEYFKKLNAASSIRSIKSAWSYCSSIYDMKATDVRARHIKGCINDGTANIKGKETKPSAVIKLCIKSMFNLMFDYALEYEIVDKNYARTFKMPDEISREKEESKKSHLPFTNEEIELLWKNVNIIPYVDILLIQCYSGWRPQELGLIELKNVNLENKTFSGGIKTNAGKNRIVPIHPKIYNLVVKKYNEAKELGSDYLINCTDAKNFASGTMMTYDKYRIRFCAIRDKLNLDYRHRAHDGRMHFITMAKKYGVDEYAIKYIVGHAIQDITEKVYTKREISWLKEEIEKIK